MADGHSERDGDAEIAGQRGDPVAAQNGDLAQAGGHAGKGAAEPSGSRTDASGPPPSNAAAPRVHAALDGQGRDADAGALRAPHGLVKRVPAAIGRRPDQTGHDRR